jgi:hypothetical protein
MPLARRVLSTTPRSLAQAGRVFALVLADRDLLRLHAPVRAVQLLRRLRRRWLRARSLVPLLVLLSLGSCVPRPARAGEWRRRLR